MRKHFFLRFQRKRTKILVDGLVGNFVQLSKRLIIDFPTSGYDFLLPNRKFHRKTPVLKSLFNEDTPKQVFSCENCKIYKGTSFYTTRPVAASLHSAFCYSNCSFVLETHFII